MQVSQATWLVLLSLLATNLLAEDSTERTLPGSENWKVLKTTDNQTVWLERPGSYFIVTDHEGKTDYPLENVEKLRARVRKQAAAEKGGLIEARLVKRNGTNVAYFITKDVYNNLNGYRYVGRCIVPLENGYREIRMDTLPTGTTGMREAVLSARLNLFADMEMEPVPTEAPPTPGSPIKARNGKHPERIKGLFFDPYDRQFDAAANYSKTDSAEYDPMFPTHQLSRLRSRFPQILGIQLEAERVDGKIESKLLKQTMIDVTADFMKDRVASVEMAKVRRSVEKGILALRSSDNDFLMLSATDEERLQAGNSLESTEKRLLEAKAFLAEYEITLPAPTKRLLDQHEAGKLTAVTKELLAHLLNAQAVQARAAIRK
ncbi:MAG: hypothetical protein AAFX06_30005 [Planctomycetota bacterium]